MPCSLQVIVFPYSSAFGQSIRYWAPVSTQFCFTFSCLFYFSSTHFAISIFAQIFDLKFVQSSFREWPICPYWPRLHRFLKLSVLFAQWKASNSYQACSMLGLLRLARARGMTFGLPLIPASSLDPPTATSSRRHPNLPRFLTK